MIKSEYAMNGSIILPILLNTSTQNVSGGTKTSTFQIFKKAVICEVKLKGSTNDFT